jgi:uncharacterized membrane protein (DUF2068 family)
MSKPVYHEDAHTLEPVHEHTGEPGEGRWTRRLVFFLRIMAAASMIKGLYHWSRVTGVGVSEHDLFAYQPIAWQVATVFFAVIDLVAAVGLWLAAAWGAVIWLMSIASMLAVEIFFPQVFAIGLPVGIAEGALLAVYLVLAVKSAQEHPQG